MFVFLRDVVYSHNFLVLDDVLADAQHLLDHLSPLDHDLFLGHGDQDLVVANLDILGCLALLNGYALYVRLFTLFGNPNRLVVMPFRVGVVLIPLTPPRAAGSKPPFLRAFTVLVVLGEPVAAVSTSHAVPPHVR
jgi:hypothetical protein